MSFTVKLTNVMPYTRKAPTIVGKENLFTINKAKDIVGTRAIVSDSADTCSYMAIKAGNRNALMHLAPEQEPIGTLRDRLYAYLDSFRENYDIMIDEMKAFIFGGREFAKGDVQSETSCNLYNEMAESLDEFGVPFTMICGKKSGMAKDDIYFASNKVYAINKSLKDLSIPENPTPKQVEDAIGQYYECVEINPEVPIEV